MMKLLATVLVLALMATFLRYLTGMHFAVTCYGILLLTIAYVRLAGRWRK